MRIGIDVQIVARGNRTGIYSFLRHTIRELRPLLQNEVWLFAEVEGAGIVRRSDASDLSAAMDGARVRVVRRPPRCHRLWRQLSLWNRVDVLTHNLGGLLPPATRAANAYVVPDVIPLAVNYGVSGFADNYRPFYDTAVRHGHVILVFSEHTKRDFLERVGGSPGLINVAPLAAAPEFRPVQDRDRLRPSLAPLGLADVPYILMVGTLETRKNHAVLLKAFKRLTSKDPKLRHRLVLVGRKWIGHEAVFALIRELGLGDRVTYLESSNRLPELYAGAEAFVFPSLYEGFGLPPLEAMACGVPVLAADATSLPEVVGDGGVLFHPHDVIGLCEALHGVVTDSKRRTHLRERALARAGMFSWRRTAELSLQAFEFGLRRSHGSSD